jgi:hypothetical protein
VKLLLTNDDGFEADGLQELAKRLSAQHQVYVVAPDSGRSCCGHSVTNAESLHVVRHSDSGWSVSGTPADCIRLATLVLKIQPDWVLSGVNHGGNLGIDTIYSGNGCSRERSDSARIPLYRLVPIHASRYTERLEAISPVCFKGFGLPLDAFFADGLFLECQFASDCTDGRTVAS